MITFARTELRKLVGRAKAEELISEAFLVANQQKNPRGWFKVYFMIHPTHGDVRCVFTFMAPKGAAGEFKACGTVVYCVENSKWVYNWADWDVGVTPVLPLGELVKPSRA